MILYNRVRYQREHDFPKWRGRFIHPLYLPDVVRNTDFTWRGLASALRGGYLTKETVTYCRALYAWHKKHPAEYGESWSREFLAEFASSDGGGG